MARLDQLELRLRMVAERGPHLRGDRGFIVPALHDSHVEDRPVGADLVPHRPTVDRAGAAVDAWLGWRRRRTTSSSLRHQGKSS
jgi:hypothetical protein